MRKTGYYEKLGNINSFIPESLPPKNPPFSMTTQMATLYGEAMQGVAKLNEMANRLPDKQRFIKAYVIKEALLSSAIEGVHTTLIDVFTQPLEQSSIKKETQLVMNYTKALDTALAMIQKEGFPISNRVILAAHKTLMSVGHGDKADPGSFRKQPVVVGNLVPPPAQEIPRLMSDLESYINTDESLPPLINAGLVHVQFETIHPFLDGNGRIGRLLIVLMLIERNLLSEPILYPSYYFKKYRMEYYQRLDAVRIKGDFEGWITYYLNAIKMTSIDAYRRAEDVENLHKKLVSQITDDIRFAKTITTRLTALDLLFRYPVITVSELSEKIDVAYNTAKQIIQDFLELEIVQLDEQASKKGLYAFMPYLSILEKEY